jgi:hypothetical protein
MTIRSVAPDDCPEPPGVRAGLSTLLLHEACETAGGVGKLAELLRTPPGLVQRWLDGDEEAPREIYRACIDIVLLHEPDEEPLNARRGAGSLPRAGD